MQSSQREGDKNEGKCRDKDTVDKTKKSKTGEYEERVANYLIVSFLIDSERQKERERQVNKGTEEVVFCFSSGYVSSQQVLAVASHSMQMGFPPYLPVTVLLHYIC